MKPYMFLTYLYSFPNENQEKIQKQQNLITWINCVAEHNFWINPKSYSQSKFKSQIRQWSKLSFFKKCFHHLMHSMHCSAD